MLKGEEMLLVSSAVDATLCILLYFTVLWSLEEKLYCVWLRLNIQCKTEVQKNKKKIKNLCLFAKTN